MFIISISSMLFNAIVSYKLERMLVLKTHKFMHANWIVDIER